MHGRAVAVRLRLLRRVAAPHPHRQTASTSTTTTATTTTTTTTTAAPAATRDDDHDIDHDRRPARGPSAAAGTGLAVHEPRLVGRLHRGLGTCRRQRRSAQKPVPRTWRLDNWGGCGTSPPQLSQNTGAAGSAYLTSSGLVLPVVATGRTSYRTAQLDTKGIAGESWQFGTIEARSSCRPARASAPPSGCSPTTAPARSTSSRRRRSSAPTFGPLAPYAIFTLHVNNTQQFQRSLDAARLEPGQPNVYGIFWTRNSITWTVNYVPYATATPQTLANPSLWSALTSGSFHLLLDVAVGGWPGDPPAGTTTRSR